MLETPTIPRRKAQSKPAPKPVTKVKHVAVLIQFAHGEPHEAMLRASYPQHAAYAEQHGFDFISGPIADPVDARFAWLSFKYLLNALRNGYEYAVFLGTDCLIVDMLTDLREAVSDYPLGMVYGQAPGGEPPHFNCGAIYIRNDKRVIEFLEELLTLQPDEGTPFQVVRWWETETCEQTIANGLLSTSFPDLCAKLDPRWNCVDGIHDTTNAVVIGWHGVADHNLKLERLKAAIK